MNDSIDVAGVAGTVAFGAVVVTLVAVTLVVIARPWELRGGRFLDKLRIGEAVSSYDFWLGLRGVSGRRRRELRAELRANLWDAAQRVGAKQAVKAVGPLRRLAADGAAEPLSPRWGFGVAVGLVALEVLVMAQVFLTTVVVDTAEAAGARKVDVAVTLVPGMRATYEKAVDGFTFGMTPGPVPFVLAALVFLWVARPWLLVRRRSVASA